jgi:hypothetical protein
LSDFPVVVLFYPVRQHYKCAAKDLDSLVIMPVTVAIKLGLGVTAPRRLLHV